MPSRLGSNNFEILDKTRSLSSQQRRISRCLTANPNVGIANWTCIGKKVGSGHIKNYIKNYRRWQPAETWVWTCQQPPPPRTCRDSYRRVTGMGWSRWRFTVSAYVAIREEVPNMSCTSPLIQKPLRYFLSCTPHQRAWQINFTPSKVLLSYQRYFASRSWFLFLGGVGWGGLFVFCFSDSSHTKYRTNETDVEFDHWH